jgi:hypothetical protein
VAELGKFNRPNTGVRADPRNLGGLTGRLRIDRRLPRVAADGADRDLRPPHDATLQRAERIALIQGKNNENAVFAPFEAKSPSIK